jgi:hypothetical protein
VCQLHASGCKEVQEEVGNVACAGTGGVMNEARMVVQVALDERFLLVASASPLMSPATDEAAANQHGAPLAPVATTTFHLVRHLPHFQTSGGPSQAHVACSCRGNTACVASWTHLQLRCPRNVCFRIPAVLDQIVRMQACRPSHP